MGKLKKLAAAALVAFVAVIVRICILDYHEILDGVIHLPFAQPPHSIFPVDAPWKYGLLGSRNFRISPSSPAEEDLGVWWIPPAGPRARFGALADLEDTENLFASTGGKRVVIYIHGQAANRAQPHRVILYRFLSAHFGAHVIAYDMRG